MILWPRILYALILSLKTKKPKTHFVCQSCGAVSPRWVGRCNECGEWNSFVEEQPVGRAQSGVPEAAGRPPQVLAEVTEAAAERIPVHAEEFDRVLGGGLVPGSLILLGGDPGIGKSTLMLQEGVALASADFRVLYVSGEESAGQTKLRARRLGLNSPYLYIMAETDLFQVLAQVEALEPGLVIVDSIQTVYHAGLDSSPGSISQVRSCAFELLRLGKQRSLPIVLIGHVTKEGYIAGPKVLEHMVDVLLQFEGDRDQFYRVLRAIKNRFGSTREIGIFEMTEAGLREVRNPSALFLEQRQQDVSGSTVVCTLEGTRPFLVEIQALVSSANYGLPQRNATGIDTRRLALLLAVLEKRVGYRLSGNDIFVNAAGGVRVDEPSADLGILVAIASSFKDAVVAPQTVFIGEVGLGGEIRAVAQIEKRLHEAAKLGFKKAVVPKFNAKNLKLDGTMTVAKVDKVEEALEEALG